MAEKAWYWLAFGVLALGLNNAFVAGRLELPRNLADRSAEFEQQLSGHVLGYITQAQVSLATQRAVAVQPAVARVQANLACAQASMARRQAQMAVRQVEMVRIQRDRIREQVLQNLRMQRNAEGEIPRPPRLPEDGTI